MRNNFKKSITSITKAILIGAGLTAPVLGFAASTLPVDPPTVITDNVSNVHSNSAVLHGRVTNNGGCVEMTTWFEYGKDTSYGSETQKEFRKTLGSFSDSISGLSPGTTYHYRAVVRNNTKTGYGSDKTFTTSGSPPSPSFDVRVSAKNISRGDTTWYNSLRAEPLELLMFRIRVISTGNSEVANIRVKNTLPTNIIYQGDLLIDGAFSSKNINTEQVNIGDLSAGQTRIITFEAQVAAETKFNYGTSNLVNTVLAYNEDFSHTDTCTIMVTRKAVAGAATDVSTGITNDIFDSILFPLALAFLMVWIFKSRFIGLDEWTHKRKKKVDEYRAKKKLKRKIAQAKSQGYFEK